MSDFYLEVTGEEVHDLVWAKVQTKIKMMLEAEFPDMDVHLHEVSTEGPTLTVHAHCPCCETEDLHVTVFPCPITGEIEPIPGSKCDDCGAELWGAGQIDLDLEGEIPDEDEDEDDE